MEPFEDVCAGLVDPVGISEHICLHVIRRLTSVNAADVLVLIKPDPHLVASDNTIIGVLARGVEPGVIADLLKRFDEVDGMCHLSIRCVGQSKLG